MPQNDVFKLTELLNVIVEFWKLAWLAQLFVRVNETVNQPVPVVVNAPVTQVVGCGAAGVNLPVGTVEVSLLVGAEYAENGNKLTNSNNKSFFIINSP